MNNEGWIILTVSFFAVYTIIMMYGSHLINTEIRYIERKHKWFMEVLTK